MERRKFIGAAGLAGILATGIAPAVQAAQAIRWRLASSFPKSQDIPFGGALSFALAVKEMSGGKIEISVYPADELMPAFGVLDGVQRGVVECGHTAPLYYTGKDETFALDSAIPFGLNARQMTAWMYQGKGHDLLREFYDDYDVVNFPLGNTGAQMGGWYRKPIKSLANLKGLKIRSGGLAAKVLERLGSVPRNLPGNEIYKALERGSIDAAEWGGPYDDLQLGLQRLVKYYGYPAWREGGAQLSLYVNQRAFKSLTSESRAIIEAAATATHVDIQTQYDVKNPPALKEFLASGAQFMPFPKSVMDAAYKAATALYAEIAEKNPRWKKIHASYARFQESQIWSAGYTDKAFDDYLRQKLAAPDQVRKSAPARRR